MPITRKKARDYLYHRLGPWPQPNQAMDLWAMVVHIPKVDQRRFFWRIQLRYLFQAIFYTPIALWYAWRNPGLSKLSDEDLAEYMCVRSFSKFMYRANRDDIQKFLPGFDVNKLNPKGIFYISDLYLMRHIPSQDGQYVATTVCLFEKEEERLEDRGMKRQKYKPLAIYVTPCAEKGENLKAGTLVYPKKDDKAWELAKYYALMGCAYRIVFSLHSTLHFPFDAINAITKSMLPKKNLILQLLLPHLEFSLELDLAVQTTKTSPIKNHQEYPYTGVTGTADEIAGLFVDANRGVKGRKKAYPPFHFKLEPQSESKSDYYQFQMEYYYCINRFVKKVVAHVSEEDRLELVPWAKWIEPHINKHINVPHHDAYIQETSTHFPTEKEILEDKNKTLLEKLLTTIIWDLTVGHAADHYDFAMMTMSHMPMRLRVPFPTDGQVPNYKRKDLRTFIDTYKHRLEWKMFYLPNNLSCLNNVDYKFKTKELQKLNTDFLEDLKKTEKGLAEKNIPNYMPLKKIARSIQY